MMKKLVMIAAAVLLVFSFMSEAKAGETAELGLKVSFKLEPLKLSVEPKGPFFVYEGDELVFKVIAEDLDAMEVVIKTGQLPEGASFSIDHDNTTANHIEGKFVWTPAEGQAQGEPYVVELMAESSNEELGIGTWVKITVRPRPVISIELAPTTWALEEVKLGEKRENIDLTTNLPIHVIRNTGNVFVTVAIAYGMPADEDLVQPGLEQGKNTFITEVLREGLEPRVLPPHDGMKVVSIMPNQNGPLHLRYGAPLALSQGIQAHGVKYELKAYGHIIDPSDVVKP